MLEASKPGEPLQELTEQQQLAGATLHTQRGLGQFLWQSLRSTSELCLIWHAE